MAMAMVSKVQYRADYRNWRNRKTFVLSELIRRVISRGGNQGDVMRWLDNNQHHCCPRKKTHIDLGFALSAICEEGKIVLVFDEQRNGDEQLNVDVIVGLILESKTRTTRRMT